MIIIVVGLLGLIFGSFVNALVWRLHEQAVLSSKFLVLRKKRQNNGKKLENLRTKNQELSVLTGRSMCPDCHHTLAAKDLVPVFSWLWLRGKCRYCRAPIAIQYPLVELLTAALFIVSYVSWPLALHGVGLFQFVLWLGFVVAFVALAIYDLRWFLLPDRLVYPLIGLAAVQVLVSAIWLGNYSELWQPVLAAVIIFGLFWILFQVSDGKWIGGGDVKLAIVLGLLVATPLRAFLVVFLSSLLGTLVSIPLIVQGKRGLKVEIPFGPYLLAATFVVVLYGSHIVNWYQNLLF